MKFQIENYESMTPEEKVAALEAYEPDMSGWVAKSTFDKTASDLAAAKKTIREKMSEDEAKKAQEEEQRTALMARVAELEQERAINGYERAYLTMGYDEKSAKSSAEALAKGDMDTVFKLQRLHSENREKAMRTELLKQTPTPAAGSPNTGKTKEEFSKMSLDEKAQFARENPDAYNDFYGGK